MNKLRLMALAALVAVPFVSVPHVNAADVVPQVGQVAPDFSLPSQDGTPVSLKEFHGKWVVLYFYPKDNTPGCTVEAQMGMKLASRNTFLVDPEGKIAKEWIGVKPAGHSAEVLAALTELEKK
jgi:peroxiredoxin